MIRYTPSDVISELEREGAVDFIIELIDCFLADSIERLCALREAAASADAAQLSKQAHTLKGSAANMGLIELASTCHDLDRRAKATPGADYRGAVEDLGRALELDGQRIAEFRDQLRRKASTVSPAT